MAKRVKLTEQERKEHQKANSRRWYEKLKSDPERYFARMERGEEYVKKHRRHLKAKKRKSDKRRHKRIMADPDAHERRKQMHNERHRIRMATDPAYAEKHREAGRKAYAKMKEAFANLTLHVPDGDAHSGWEKKIENVTYVMEENPLGFRNVRFTFDGDGGILHYENARGEKEIAFGLGSYVEGRFPEYHYSGRTIGVPKEEGYKCLATAVWIQENQLLLRVNVVDDYLGTLGITFGFKGNEVGLYAEKGAEAFLTDYAGFAGGRCTERELP